jgi:hypothetical protein
MVKLMALTKLPRNVSVDDFRHYWNHSFFPAFHALPLVREHLIRAAHNPVIPMAIRGEETTVADQWAGAACYYFDSRVMAEAVLADPAYRELRAEHSDIMSAFVHLLVEEVWIYNRDTSHLPIKAFAFFKRQPKFSRLEALQYYQGPHAELGETVNRGRTVRYIQNHTLLDYRNPDTRHDYDGGPEIWFKSMETAMDLFGDKQAMATLAEDEERFVLRDQLVHFLAEEEILYDQT